MNRKKVAVAGATGFVGTAIIDSLLSDFQVRGLTRSVGKISQAARMIRSNGLIVTFIPQIR